MVVDNDSIGAADLNNAGILLNSSKNNRGHYCWRFVPLHTHQGSCLCDFHCLMLLFLNFMIFLLILFFIDLHNNSLLLYIIGIILSNMVLFICRMLNFIELYDILVLLFFIILNFKIICSRVDDRSGIGSRCFFTHAGNKLLSFI